MPQPTEPLGQAILGDLKTGSLGETLGEDLNRIFTSFMLMYQNEIDSPDFIRPVHAYGWQKWH